MIDSDPIGLVTYLAKELNSRNLAYLHLMRGDFFQQQSGDVLTPVRENYDGILIANMGYPAAEAAEAIASGIDRCGRIRHSVSCQSRPAGTICGRGGTQFP